MAFEIGLQGWRLFVQSCLVLLAGGIARFLTSLYRIRRKFQRMQSEGLVSLWNCAFHVLSLASMCYS